MGRGRRSCRCYRRKRSGPKIAAAEGVNDTVVSAYEKWLWKRSLIPDFC